MENRRSEVIALSRKSSSASKGTIIEHNIPEYINNKNLRSRLFRSFDTRGEKRLKEILRFEKPKPKTLNFPKRKSVSYSADPNDLLMDQFLTVKNSSVWKTILTNFKSNPNKLFKIISNSKKKKSGFKENRKSMTLYTENLSDEEEVVTFKSNDHVPEDWAKSLLYWKVQKDSGGETMTADDIKNCIESIPRTQLGLEKGIEKGLLIIETFLIEMLGTKNDMQTIKSFFSQISIKTYEAVFEKCLEISKIRNKTIKILKLVHEREKLFKNIQVFPSKQLFIQICLVNKKIKPLLSDWERDPAIPFSSFVFKSFNYLKKIENDSLILQNFL